MLQGALENKKKENNYEKSSLKNKQTRRNMAAAYRSTGGCGNEAPMAGPCH